MSLNYNFQDHVAVVTGASRGIGKAIAKGFADSKCSMALLSRNINDLKSVKTDIENSTIRVECFPCDISRFDEVQSTFAKIYDSFGKISFLINNAGLMHPPKTLNAQGYEIQFAVNHLSHMLLTIKLLPIIENKDNARIVTVTSGAQFFGKTKWDNLKAENYYNKWESYANSKLANVMFALELNTRLNPNKTFSLAAHPGVAKTNLFNAQKPNPSPLEKFSLELFSPIFQSAEMGALPQLYAATSENAKSGEHYGPKYNFRGYPKLSPPSPFAKDKFQRERLWDKSYSILEQFI